LSCVWARHGLASLSFSSSDTWFLDISGHKKDMSTRFQQHLPMCWILRSLLNTFLLHPYNYPVKPSLSSLPCRWKNWGPERWKRLA
jgi:hypothetical protein